MAKKKPQPARKQQKTAQNRSSFQVSGANAEPVRSRLGGSWSVEEERNESGAPNQETSFLAKSSANDPAIEDMRPRDPLLPPPPHPERISNLPAAVQDQFYNVFSHDNVSTVTNGLDPQVQDMMNANGTHPAHRHQQQQPHGQRHQKNPVTDVAVAAHTHSSSTGSMRSHIQVAKPYVFHQAIDGCLHDLGVAQAREDNIRLAGVQWIENVRKALKLPVRTFDTAVIYYHKFRLSHADNEYSFVDAAAAALFAACKIEDTLKKSRDILCAAHNLKVSSRADHLSSDDPMFEHQSRTIIGLERLMLEASSFDFRNRHPQHLLVKVAKYYGFERHSAVTKTAYLISIDLYRTFAPLKQSTAAMAFACLELAGRLHGQEMEAIVDGRDYARWGIERAMVMGMVPHKQATALLLYKHRPLETSTNNPRNISQTLLDLLDLYTHYRTSTSVGPHFPIDSFLEIRIPLNEELSTRRMPRYTEYVAPSELGKRAEPAGYAGAATNGVLPSANGLPPNGRPKASPTSPATPITPGTPGIRQKAGERGKEGTVRFMLNPDREREEKMITIQYAPLLASMRR